jgi:hypothetical protein
MGDKMSPQPKPNREVSPHVPLDELLERISLPMVDDREPDNLIDPEFDEGEDDYVSQY